MLFVKKCTPSGELYESEFVARDDKSPELPPLRFGGADRKLKLWAGPSKLSCKIEQPGGPLVNRKLKQRQLHKQTRWCA